jgi:hypothetical protein
MKTLVLSTLVSLSAFAAQARDMTYICTLKVPASQGWVPSQLVILHKDDEPTALVNDPIIAHFVKKPVEAKVVANNRKRIAFTWELKEIVNREGQETQRFNYRAAYIKTTGKISVSARPDGFSDVFDAYGTCEVK